MGLDFITIVKGQHEFDSFHPAPNLIYRIVTDVTYDNNRTLKFATSPYQITSLIGDKKVPIRNVLRLYPAIDRKMRSAEASIDVNGAFADSSFFEISGYDLLDGEKKLALTTPASLIISKQTSVALFGEEFSLGKKVMLDGFGQFRITGIFDAPVNSHLNYSIYASTATLDSMANVGAAFPELDDLHVYNRCYSYIELDEPTALGNLNEALDQISIALGTVDTDDGEKFAFKFHSENILDIIPSSRLLNTGKSISVFNLIVFLGFCLVILLLGIFNYATITLAHSLNRAKEIAVRKVSGATVVNIRQQI
ncbi:MAG TPA: ABC transporter permease, partial [Cyclobacteriaceae bacterium]|nr:ABC transporter permease [Cyclobacteriaceae bacterium]